jgi:tetraacyldisaccharide 4'-kinase
LRAQIKEIAGQIPIFTSNIKLAEVRPLDRKRSRADVSEHKNAFAAFCGIGNPNSFFTLLRREGFEVIHSRSFHDHHSYTQLDINQVVREASARGATALVTTTKDSVKLRSLAFEMPCYVVDIAIHIEQAEEFFRFINQSIKA